MYDLTYVRSLFPVTRKYVYVNHAAVSPYSTRVCDALAEHQETCLHGGDRHFEDWMARREHVRRQIADLIHTTPGRIAFTKNTSEGLNFLAAGMPWTPGDRILLADCEFPANVYPFLNCERRGVTVDFVKSRDGRLTVEDFAKRYTPSTRLLSVSFVEFVNGFRTDLASIGRWCRERGVVFCVDAIQGLGCVPLDAEACGVDFLSCGGHKWLMAPSGIGFIYVTPELLSRLSMSHLGWLSVKDAWNFLDFRIDPEDGPRRYEMATENFSGVYGLGASVGLLLEYGVDAIYAHVTGLLDALGRGLSELGCERVSSMHPAERSGILSFRLRGERTAACFERLAASGIQCSLREGLIRFSPHLYNTVEDIDKIVRAVRKFLE